jgi:murein DD-endopeptidase MepM/ murein hydrolase activator NlpD
MFHRFISGGYRADSGRVIDPCKPKRKARQAGGYVLRHDGHQFRLGPVTFWIGVGSLVVMAGWSLATGTYFAFHDDVITRMIARQADMQYSYEDRIADLRTQLDRTASRQMLDQEQIERKIEQIMRRQSTLESRTLNLLGMPDNGATGSIKPSTLRGPQIEPLTDTTPKASPISDTVIFTVPADREARLESREPVPAAKIRVASNAANGGIESRIAVLQEALDRIELRQIATLNSIEESFDSRAKRMRSVLADLGVDAGKAPSVPSAVGGPFVPATPAADSGAFERQIYRINIARAHVERLTRTLSAVPVRKPITGEIDLSSGFGVRMDPFVRAMAMHTGIDFRSSTGDPVRVTANGTVTSAGWSGGYGRMIEIDHGNGFSTRYGHLSEILVKAGERVKIGQTIGRVHICITRPVSMARRSIRRNSCAPASGSATTSRTLGPEA